MEINSWIKCKVMSAFLASVSLCVACHDGAPDDAPFDDVSVRFAQADDTTMVVHPFVREGLQYVVLPSYWDSTKVVVAMENEGEKTGFRSCGQETRKTVQLMQSKLPAVFISTESGSMDFVNADKKNEETGHITVVDTLGEVEYDGKLENIHGRGNSTWFKKKKPYSIKLAHKATILGLQRAKKFTLLSQPDDPTGLRNWIALSVAKQMGLNGNMDIAFANVYLNGNYAGCYLVTNKVDHKVPHDYLLELGYWSVDKDKTPDAFPMSHGGSLTLKKPKHPSVKQRDGVDRDWKRVEEALMNPTGESADLPIDSLIDMQSFVSNYVCQEVFKNMDAGTGSFYFGKDSLGRFYADPLWDMDMSLHCPKECLLGHELCRVIYAGAGVFPDEVGYNGVWGMLYKNEQFRQQAITCYFDQVKEMLWGESWNQIRAFLQTDMSIDNLRWNKGMDLESDCDQMREWMQERMRFLDWVWNEGDGEEKCTITFQIPRTLFNPIHLIQYVVPKHQKFTEPLPEFSHVQMLNMGEEYTFAGYEVEGHLVDFDTLVVRQDMFVLGTWKQTQKPGIISKLKQMLR